VGILGGPLVALLYNGAAQSVCRPSGLFQTFHRFGQTPAWAAADLASDVAKLLCRDATLQFGVRCRAQGSLRGRACRLRMGYS
jgi:hypothetical protein